MRALLALTLLPCIALADEIDLRQRRRGSGQPATYVLRAEGGNEFAPFGYAGGAFSWLLGSNNELEFGLGGGFPGLQLGFAARQLFGEGPQFLLVELSLAGNTKIDRGASDANRALTVGTPQSSLWTSLGLGFEQRGDLLDVSIAGDLVFTTSSLTPHFAIHGGVGFGF